MKKPNISIKLRARDYDGLVDLGNRLLSFLTGNSNYTTPVPSLVNLLAAITDVEDAKSAWANGLGTKADLADLRQKSLTLLLLIIALGYYVRNTAVVASGSDFEAMAAILATSGFDLESTPSLQGVLEKVQNFHNSLSRKLYPNQVKLMWRAPLNVTSAGNVKDYHVYRGTTTVFSDAEEIASTTRTSFVDTNSTGATVTWTYWAVAVNNAGPGVPSDPITVSILGI